jgi:hypothetical protein
MPCGVRAERVAGDAHVLSGEPLQRHSVDRRQVELGDARRVDAERAARLVETEDVRMGLAAGRVLVDVVDEDMALESDVLGLRCAGVVLDVYALCFLGARRFGRGRSLRGARDDRRITERRGSRRFVAAAEDERAREGWEEASRARHGRKTLVAVRSIPASGFRWPRRSRRARRLRLRRRPREALRARPMRR